MEGGDKGRRKSREMEMIRKIEGGGGLRWKEGREEGKRGR